MRPTPWLEAERYRISYPPYLSEYGDDFGAFLIDGPCRMQLKVIVSSAVNGLLIDPSHGWDHVSVSLSNRPPNWEEMCFIKHLFFDDEECVAQFHVPASKHINIHPHCLHLWRPAAMTLPLPPEIMV